MPQEIHGISRDTIEQSKGRTSLVSSTQAVVVPKSLKSKHSPSKTSISNLTGRQEPYLNPANIIDAESVSALNLSQYDRTHSRMKDDSQPSVESGNKSAPKNLLSNSSSMQNIQNANKTPFDREFKP